MIATLAMRSATRAARSQATRFTGVAQFHSATPLMHGKGSACDRGIENPELAKAVENYVKDLETNDYPEELRGSHPGLDDILAENKVWVERMNKEDPEFFNKLGGTQVPKYLYIGCADARVDPARLMGLPHGKIFVHRNVGNVVNGTDLNVLTAVEFAVKVLKVPHILVVGHMDCGAVRGSIAKPDEGGLGIVENWLRSIRDVARIHKDELFSIKDNEQRVRKLVELNVMEQCLNVLKIGVVQRARAEGLKKGEKFQLPLVHGLVFDPKNGVLQKIPVPSIELSDSDKEIYSLYQVDK